ncbi:MAG: hypothetical protein AB8H47_24975 [Bacteroidia bacterium]
MASPTVSCPHCLSANPAFVAQRCASCQLNMRSDQEQTLLGQQIQPQVEQLEGLLRSAPQSIAEIQPILAQLAPYRQDYSFLEEVIQNAQNQIEPLQKAAYERQKRLVIHLGILLVLLIAPLLSSWWEAPLYLTGLFFLPVLGWFALGIWPLVRNKKA